MNTTRFIIFAASLLVGLTGFGRLAAQESHLAQSDRPVQSTQPAQADRPVQSTQPVQSILPQPTREAKPGLRWWWLGSAVDKENLSWCLNEYAQAGAGAVEITPIYGVQGNDANEIPYLSPQWMEMLRHVEAENQRLGIETDMSTCTGWPFGGPWVPIEEAACKAFVIDTLVGPQVKSEEIDF